MDTSELFLFQYILWCANQPIEWWKSCPEEEKKIIKEYMPKFTKDLLNKGRRTVKLIV